MKTAKEYIIKRSDIKMYRSRIDQYTSTGWIVSYSFMFKGEMYNSPFYNIYPEISIKDQILSQMNNVMRYTGKKHDTTILISND